jgi:hypothetical protein
MQTVSNLSLNLPEDALSSYLKSNSQMCIQQITAYLDSLICEGCIWNNEYGRIDEQDERKLNTNKYTSPDQFFVIIHYINNVAYYKILPQGSTSENCEFLRNPNAYDGYFLDSERKDNLPRDALDKLCRGRTVPLNVYDTTKPRIEIYFV